MKRLVFAASILLLLAACAVTPQSPEQALYIVNGDFIAALDVANAYKGLPACGSPGANAVCSNPAIVTSVAGYANCVASVLAVAQNKVRNITTPVQTKCNDPGMSLSVQAVNSLDINGIAALARQLVGTFTSMTASLKTK